MPVWGAVMRPVISTNVPALTHLGISLGPFKGLGQSRLYALKDNCCAEERQETLFFCSLCGGERALFKLFKNRDSRRFI